MQTLKDELIKDLIIVLVPLTLSSDLLYIDIGPIKKEYAIFIMYNRLLVSHYFFTQVLVVTVIRYLIIFHGPVIESIEDKKVVIFSRTISLCWSLLSLFYESFIEEEDLTKRPSVLILTGENPNLTTENTTNTIYFIVGLDIIVVVFVYIRIELYKRMGNSYPLDGYKLGSVRTTVSIIVFCGSLIILRINISLFFATFNMPIERLIFHIIVQFLAVNVIPILMILNNEKIAIYAKTKFMCNNVVDNTPPI